MEPRREHTPVDRLVGAFGAAWGAIGVFAMLLWAIYRLGRRALEAWELGLTGMQWSLVVAVCVFMAYSEGYRGFQQRFSPRTAARIRYLRDRPRPLHSILGPAFAMGFFHATRRTQITAFALSIGIVILVILVHRLAQPWRGIIDAGVVLGLAWGVISLAIFTAQALVQPEFAPSPEVPSS